MTSGQLTLVLGGGTIGSAIAWYLYRAGLPAAMVIETADSNLRRPVCFSEALFSGKKKIGDLSGVLVTPEDIEKIAEEKLEERWKKAVWYNILNRTLPIFSSADFPSFLELLHPPVIIRSEPDTFASVSPDSADLVIGMFPHHIPGKTCHLAIESRYNYWLGNVYCQPPEKYADFDFHFFKNPFSHVFSPLEGVFVAYKEIGDKIKINEPFGTVNGIEIRSPYNGQIWGLFHSGRIIHPKQALAIVHQGVSDNQFAHFGFYEYAIAGAVLREVLKYLNSLKNTD